MKLTLALVGCGAISKKHLTAIYENEPTYTLTAVCDVDRDRAEAAASAYASERSESTPAIYTDVHRMLAGAQPDVVAIATPSAYHAEAIIAALEHGAHVIAEKPLALSTADMDRIEEAARAADRMVTVCYVTRFAPHIRLLADALQRCRFGRIFHVGLSIYWNRNDEYYRQAPWRGTWELDGGALMNQCTHGIDLLQWLCGGRPLSVSAQLRRFLRPIEAEDFGTAVVTFADGPVAHFTGTVVTYPKNLGTQLTVIGEHGTVQLGGNALNAVTAWRFEDADPEEEARVLAGDFGSPRGKQGHPGVYEDLAKAVRDGKPPLPTLEEARRSVDLVLGMYRSAKSGTRVDFPVSFATSDMESSDLV